MKPNAKKIHDVMTFLGQRSAEVRLEKLGKRELSKRMSEYGKLGGRPKKEK